ncbi:hypothetical protein PG994_003716 [Apiospora phragmitis]|uniref:Uncharacterized protein n=1 Tax=Apiospora phragmitis TaxID=2905665 RepID=A0ABR1W2Q7_9PEZI
MHSMYASQRPPSGKAAKILGATEDFSGVPPTPKNPFHNYTDLLEPALDGPPSPERLRQLSQEMRRPSQADVRRGSQADIRRGSHADIRHGSLAEKHQSQHTTSSGSSSLLSGSSDRPSWEHGLEQLTLSRKSSQRSTTSSMPSREGRPESLQIFGKTLFNRRDPRYARRPTAPCLRTEDFHFANFSSESLTGIQETPSAGLHARKNSELQARPLYGQERTQTHQSRYSPPAPIRPLVKRTQSEEQMRGPPPRPPRSPIGMSYNSPVPPPRLSSRTPSREDIDPLERPMTNCSSRQPAPFVLSPAPPMPEPPATAQGLISEFLGPNEVVEQQIGSHAITTPDDVAWPLTANVLTALPDVPEEEESSRQDGLSVASNNSSLRGSVSAPTLRQRSQAQVPGQHPRATHQKHWANSICWQLSVLCERLAMKTRACTKTTLTGKMTSIIATSMLPKPTLIMLGTAILRHDARLRRRGAKSEDNQAETVAELSSQTSLASSQGVITPTLQQGPVTSNFSLPRRDSSTLAGRGHTRVPSRVSAFKEAQGFISPSLLIPNDYHQQMLLHESEFREEDEDDEVMFLSHGTGFLDPADFKKANARASSSTTHSALSDQSASSSRHRSATSNSTAYTRWTAGSAATSIESWQAPSDDSDNTVSKDHDEVSPLPVFQDVFKRDASRERHVRAQSHANVLAPNDDAEVSPVTVDGPSPNLPVKSRRRARTTSRSHNNPPAQFGLFPAVPGSYNLPGGRI